MAGNLLLEQLDETNDKWIIPYDSSLGQNVSFDFTFLPNDWFKKIHKEVTRESLIIGKPSVVTLVRYNTAFRRFFEYIEKYIKDFNTYENLTYDTVQSFIFDLRQQKITNSTKNMSMSALKWIVSYGQLFEIEGFPTTQIFDGDEYKSLKSEDILKTEYITDDIMAQIEAALRKEKNLMLKSIIEIGIDTGIRLSEVLNLKTTSLTEDFTGKPILHIESNKNNTERFIPVSNRVKKAFNTLISLSEDGRDALNSDIITVYYQRKGKPPRYGRLTQSIFRKQIKIFMEKHQIKDKTGNIYPLKFHQLRHTLGTEMINRGMSIFEIADYLGHESTHSTSHYAKFKKPTVQKEYKKLGFIGTIVEKISEASLSKDKIISENTIQSAALPDGHCSKPIDGKGNVCAKFNMCIICPKFITTPEHLETHKSHLIRLRNDKEKYIKSEYIGTLHHLESIEKALVTIIDRLEEMKNG